MKPHLAIALLTALLLALASSCRPGSDRIIIIAADDGWDSNKFHNALAKLIIDNAFEGYELRFSTASAMMNWESMKSNDIDLHLEQWIDTIPTFYDDVRNGYIIKIGVVVEDSRQGIYVPRFVIEGDPSRGIPPMTPTLRRIEDLKNYSHIFTDIESPVRGRFYGSIPGWTADAALHRRFIYLGLDNYFNYIRLGSEAALFASLVAAYHLGQPWVGYSWEPSWIVGQLDLVMLEDIPYETEAFAEGRTGFSTQELLILSSRRFPERAPQIHEFLKRFRTGGALLSEALAHLHETRASHEAAAIWFLRRHDHLIDEWLPPENAQKLRDYLARRR